MPQERASASRFLSDRLKELALQNVARQAQADDEARQMRMSSATSQMQFEQQKKIRESTRLSISIQ